MPYASSAIKDQAHQLRQLKIQAARADGGATSRRPNMMLVAGTSDAHGTTLLATNLAVALARHGQRVAFATTRSRLPAELARHYPDQQTADDGEDFEWQVGPSGLIVAPLTDDVFRDNRFERLHSIGSCADMVILDAGIDFRFRGDFPWRSEDNLLVVTTPDNAAIMDTYANMKQLREDLALRPIRYWIVVNRSADATEAQLVYDRIASTCQRFLACQPAYAGCVPATHQLKTSTGCSLLSLQSPTSDFARAIDLMAAVLTTPDAQTKAPVGRTREQPTTITEPSETELEFPDK